MTKTYTVSLYGGPGTGKSTTMAGIFHKLKVAGLNVEMATEWIKEKVWANLGNVAQNQLYVFAKQEQRLRALQGNVDFAITDSPLALSLHYGRDVEPPEFRALVRRKIADYRNIHIFLRRVKPYNPAGRFQDEEGAKEIDRELFSLLRKFDPADPVLFLAADEHAAETIAGLLLILHQQGNDSFRRAAAGFPVPAMEEEDREVVETEQAIAALKRYSAEELADKYREVD